MKAKDLKNYLAYHHSEETLWYYCPERKLATTGLNDAHAEIDPPTADCYNEFLDFQIDKLTQILNGLIAQEKYFDCGVAIWWYGSLTFDAQAVASLRGLFEVAEHEGFQYLRPKLPTIAAFNS